ncbi:MAG: hypothetical protein GKS01_12715 [Alphaproteobacteria bacterium]|nr:hypothetical protein [Alphaproteobacteria bacterium]
MATPIDTTPNVESSQTAISQAPSQSTVESNVAQRPPTTNIETNSNLSSSLRQISTFNPIEPINYSNITSLQDLIESASAAPPIRPLHQTNRASQGFYRTTNKGLAPQVRTGDTVRDAIRSLVNVTGSNQNPNIQGSARPTSSRGSSVFTEVMNLRMSSNVYQTMARVISPEITADGATLGLFGIRRFTVVFSPLTKKIGVGGTQSANQTTLNYTNRVTPRLKPRIAKPPPKRSNDPRRFQQPNPVRDLIESAKEFTSTYVLHPFALIAFMFVGMLWLMFKLRRNTA